MSSIKQAIYKRLVSYFIQGIIFTLPVAATLYIIYKVFVFIDSIITDWLPESFSFPGLGIIIIICLITILGFLANTIVATPIKNYFHRLLQRAPLLNTIYTAIQDLLQAVVGKKKGFTQAVLVKMNRESEIEKPGFITQEDLSALGIQNRKVAVYLPHSYNFSGNIYIVPAENITLLPDVNAGDFMKFIVSGGVSGLSAIEENSDIQH